MKPLNDMFGHKIHASEDGWANRLCAIAEIFHRYSGKRYAACESELKDAFVGVAPRISALRTNPQYRDEITAYVSYLGVAKFRLEQDEWVIRTTETAQRFLLCEAPDVGAFLRLQLLLFQYPNGMGVDHKNLMKVQTNALEKTRGFVKSNAHISPMRLLVAALGADASLRNIDLLEAEVNYRELYALANHPDIYTRVLPHRDTVSDVLRQVRSGEVNPPAKLENRFHVLNHTHVFNVRRNGQLGYCQPSEDVDVMNLHSQINAIANVDLQFDKFDQCEDADALKRRILSNEWADYFDALNQLPGSTVDDIVKTAPGASQRGISKDLPPLRPFDSTTRPYTEEDKGDFSSWAAPDPEITRIKCERRNATHALMVARLLEWLEDHVNVQEVGDSQHIDLWAKLQDGRVFIFEVKSGGEGLFEQIRKGVSQLYEYRYRYSKEHEEFMDSIVCLVVPNNPPATWLPDYLCRDREINLCIHPLDDEQGPTFHHLCLAPIVENPDSP